MYDEHKYEVVVFLKKQSGHVTINQLITEAHTYLQHDHWKKIIEHLEMRNVPCFKIHLKAIKSNFEETKTTALLITGNFFVTNFVYTLCRFAPGQIQCGRIRERMETWFVINKQTV